jgi:uncharacterized protein (TIGR03437 family)
MVRSRLLLLAFASVGFAAPPSPKVPARAANLLAGQPLRFEESSGSFLVRGQNYSLRLKATENELTFLDPHAKKKATLRTRFAGSNATAKIEGLEPLAVRSNYFLGSTPAGWRSDVRNYSKARVAGIYSGIDLLFYGNEGKLEYDFLVQAGADPRAIRLNVSGASNISIDDSGALTLTTPSGDVKWNRPVAYQEVVGKRRAIDVAFSLDAHRVRFHLGDYDRSLPLVIDPVLSYASYLGGAGNEIARAIGTDASGNVYVAGTTSSPALPVSSSAAQTTYGGGTFDDLTGDVFVAKFSPAGALLYLTYLGGSEDDVAWGIAVDSTGNSYITGYTTSTNFPVTPGVIQGTFKGTGGNSCERFGDAFVAKINPSGTQILYATYLGGRLDDAGTAIAIDSSGNAYIAGSALSSDFPTTTGVVQPTFGGSGGEPGKPYCNGAPWFDTGDAFVAKINPTATQLLFSTFLGGASDDVAFAIAVDSAQNVYVAGATLSSNFPTTPGAFQTKWGGEEPQNPYWFVGDAFITKLNSTGTALVYSTFLGGTGDDVAYGLFVDKAGTAYVTGGTSSQNFPIVGTPVQRNYAGYFTLPFLIEQLVGDAFVAHLNATGTALLYSTYLGGGANDLGYALTVDSSGIIYVTGETDSPDFPTTAGASQRTFGGDGGTNQYLPTGDGFLAIINPGSNQLVYSTYIGGSLDDSLIGMASDPSGNLWLTGNTVSTNLAVSSNAFQKTFGGEKGIVGPFGDAVLIKFSSVISTGPVLTGIQNNFSYQSGAVSPGMIFILYGANMGPSTLTGASLDASGNLANSAAGVQILFDGNPAPLVYVSATQSAGIVPYEVAGKTASQITVQYNSQTSAALGVPVKAAVPGIFTFNSSGAGTAVFNQNFSANSASNPAAKGSVVFFYGTGEGQTNPPGVDGKIAGAGSLATPVLTCSATVGATPATTLYCGSVPGVVEGEFQMNLQLSSAVPSGAQPLVVTVGTAQAQTGLVVYVQ